MPVGNIVVAGVEVSGAYQGDKEDQITGEREEEPEPVAGKQFTWTTPMRMVVPVIIASSAPCGSTIYGRFAPCPSIFPLDLGGGTGEGSGHGAIPSANSLLLFLLEGALHYRRECISIKTVFIRAVADLAFF